MIPASTSWVDTVTRKILLSVACTMSWIDDLVWSVLISAAQTMKVYPFPSLLVAVALYLATVGACSWLLWRLFS